MQLLTFKTRRRVFLHKHSSRFTYSEFSFFLFFGRRGPKSAFEEGGGAPRDDLDCINQVELTSGEFHVVPGGYEIIQIRISGKRIVVSSEDEGFSSIPFWEGLRVN